MLCILSGFILEHVLPSGQDISISSWKTWTAWQIWKGFRCYLLSALPYSDNMGMSIVLLLLGNFCPGRVMTII